jgi:hypothetical protein
MSRGTTIIFRLMPAVSHVIFALKIAIRLKKDFNILFIINYYHPIKVVMNYYDVGIIQ